MNTHSSGLPIETVRSNLTRVMARQQERIDALEAKIRTVGTPHDLQVRLRLEYDQRELAVKKQDLARTAAQLAAL